MEKIEHFSHEHPLIVYEDQRGTATCDACHERILGSRCRCEECDYDLHKSCAELPRELQHPLHRKHPLILLLEPPYDPKQFKCQACEKTYSYDYKYKALFLYHCSLCKFDLDIKCASLPLTMEVESHDHPLTLIRKLISFTCDACGKEDRGMPYLCAMCAFWFHSKCAFSPRTVKNIRHKHPLKLTYSLQNDQSDHRFCQICVENVDLDYWVYHCSICDFVAHLNCATDARIRDEDFVLESEDKGPIDDESILQLKYEDARLDEIVDSVPYIVKKTNLEGDGKEIAVEIRHFSHEHDLTLIDKLDFNNQKCDGCIRPIFPPFYSCAQCNFVLHKSCVELRIKKRHPVHQHLFTLLPKAPRVHSSYFFDFCSYFCDVCRSQCNGFSYHCNKCNFYLDVKCSLISDTLTHDGHEHPLFLSNATNKLNCSACDGYSENMFRCSKCEFALDFKCATLPRTIWYRQHQHSFNLQFTAEDESGEYYCDICEKPQDPKYWFYYCAEYSYPAHPKCILGNYPHIKFEKTYTFDFHLHPLTLIKEIEDKAPCDKCGEDCGVFHFKCTQCNFKVHRWPCIGEMMTNG